MVYDSIKLAEFCYQIDNVFSGYTNYPGSMRHMARGNMFPDYEELQRDSPGSTVRLFVLLIYFIVNVIVSAALILLVVLAPTRFEFAFEH